MGRLLTIPLALFAIFVGAMVWSGGSSRDGRAEFSFINRNDILTLDISKMTYLQDIRMANAMWEGLYSYDPKTLEPLPGAATSVDINPEKTEYTFHLRPTARWSNGDPVTSHDFVFAWRRIIEEPGEYTYLHYYVKNAQEYQDAFLAYQKYLQQLASYKRGGSKGIAPTPVAEPSYETVGVKAIDNYTLRVITGAPVVFFLDLVAFSPFFPLHEPSMKPFREEADANEPRIYRPYRPDFARPPYVVTNGPYRLASWQFRQRLRLERNEYYWDRQNVHTKNIDMVVVDDEMARYQLFDDGTLDWLAEAPREIAPDLLKQKHPFLHTSVAFGTAYLTVNCLPMLPEGAGKNPLADRRVRQALCMAIDKEQIVQNVTRLGEQAATTYIPPGAFQKYDFKTGRTHNVKEAQKLLAEAGYADGKNFPTLTLLFRTDQTVQKTLVQDLQRQWQQTLNLKFEIEGLEPKNVKERVAGKVKRFHIAPSNWFGDYGDPSTFTDKFMSTSLGNDCAWINPEYDKDCENAAKETDPAKRYQMLADAEHILNDWVPIIPLYHPVNTYLYDPAKVQGIYLHPRDTAMFKAIVVRR